jgi:hypothetical protein
MSTAVIVSGVLRYMRNATSSWKFDADYFLHVDNNIVLPQSKTITGHAVDVLADNLKQSKIKFITVTIDLDNSAKFNQAMLEKYENIVIHPIFNMIWRWKTVYNQLKLYNTTRQYKKILLLRPDIWLFNKADMSLFNSIEPAPNTVYTTAELFHEDKRNKKIMNDVMLLTDFTTFGVLANFFDYYVENYAKTTMYNGDDVHSMLAQYVIENNITVNSRLGDLFDFIVLRDNSVHMFNDQGLLPEYSPTDLVNKQTEWWNEHYK